MPRRISEPQRPEPRRKPIVESGQAGRLLTPKEAARVLNLSESWLAKARMRGDGPPYLKPRRSVRYPEIPLQQWIKARLRLSTSEL
jgi:hypothetical protein